MLVIAGEGRIGLVALAVSTVPRCSYFVVWFCWLVLLEFLFELWGLKKSL